MNLGYLLKVDERESNTGHIANLNVVGFMGTKNISISDEAYARLASHKKRNESFTDVINRLTEKKFVLELGRLLSKKEGEAMVREIREVRKQSHRRLAGLIEESVGERSHGSVASRTPQTFKALRNKRVVAEAKNLETLGKKIEELKVDSQSVKIISSKKLPPTVRTGLRERS